MNEWQSDFELLRQFVGKGSQSAFAALARRHLNMVYATALRKVDDSGGAEEIAQNVFCALARKAWQFAPDDSLPGWLHKTALLESKCWLRGQIRRRRREEAAADLGTTMKTPEDQPALSTLVPLLDDALLSLRERERAALLLRYYEKQSLRDLGAALGVSEDTAQKRVQSALEKLAAFFQRHGFKTATTALAAAALRSTATSASATAMGAVVGATSKVAPLGILGLGAVLARLASLSRMQTAAVCVVVAAAPAAWQLSARRTADGQVQGLRAQLLAAQINNTAAQTELDQVRTDSDRLEQSLAQANDAAARAAASAQAFADWKQKIRAQLMAADSRWDESSPFARIPKAVLPGLSELTQISPFTPPGVVNPDERELLGMTAAEHQVVEETLQRVADLQRGEKLDVYETDEPAKGRALASKVFADQPAGKVGPEAEQRFSQMLADLRGILGEDRWAVVPSRFRNVDCQVLNDMLIPKPSATISAKVENDEQGIPKARWTFVGDATPAGGLKESRENSSSENTYSLNVVGYVNGDAALSAFLPNGDPDQNNHDIPTRGLHVSDAMRQHMTAWFQEQASTRRAGKEKP